MTINDIMIRDLAEAERIKKHDEEQRERKRSARFRLWRRRFHAAINYAGMALAVAVLALIAYCYASDRAHKFHAVAPTATAR